MLVRTRPHTAQTAEGHDLTYPLHDAVFQRESALQALLLAPKRQTSTRLLFRTAAMTVETVEHRSEVSSPAKADAKVEQLRKLMAAADGGKGVQAYIIPSEDPHMVPRSAQADSYTAIPGPHWRALSCFFLTRQLGCAVSQRRICAFLPPNLASVRCPCT